MSRSLAGTVGVLLGTLALLLLTDRPGLLLKYHATPIEMDATPVFREVGMPHLDSRKDVARVLISQELFELRWRGWLAIEEPGEYQFLLKADEAAFLRIGQGRLVETSRSLRTARMAPIELSKGVYPVEVGLSQTGGRARLELRWGLVGEGAELLVGDPLIAYRPAFLRASLPGRELLMGRENLRWTLAAIGGLAGLVLLVGSLRPLPTVVARSISSIQAWMKVGSRRRRLQAVFLLGLGLLTFVLVLPYTASTTDGDDIRYMDGARFNKQMGWNMNRYAHIYALKAFIWGVEGDAFEASRLYWAFLFSVTVISLAFAARSLGPGMQLGTLAVVLLLLFAQPYVWGGIGAAYADYSAMMFVALGLAVYLHGYSTQQTSSSKWHAAALGALSVAAAKSKEPGLILLWLMLALVWSGGRLDVRRFSKRLLWWMLGASAAYLALMSLDGLVLKDFWFSLRLESVAGAQRLKDAAEGIWQLPRWAWLQVAWTAGPLRKLSLLVLASTVIALLRRWPVELRWVALMPTAFMAMMIAIHPAISSPRYFFPIIPVACFVGAMAIRDLSSMHAGRRAARGLVSAGLAVVLLAMLAPGLVETWTGLARHRTAQRGDWTLYPWEVFRQSIEESRPKEILVSPRLYRTYQMMGKAKTRDRIARLYFQRRHLKLRERLDPTDSTEMAVISRSDFKRWLETRPELAKGAIYDPSGRIVLVRFE